MWELIDEFNISLKIINDLFEGIKSDIKERVKLNSKKELLNLLIQSCWNSWLINGKNFKSK